LYGNDTLSDSSFENIVAVNGKKNVVKFMGAALRVRNIHAYGYPKKDSCNHVIRIETANSLYAQLYCDTPLIGGLYVSGGGNMIQQVFVLFNSVDIATAIEPFAVYIKANGNRLRDVHVSWTDMLDTDGPSCTDVIVDNTGANIFDVTVDGIGHTGTQPQNTVKLKGKQPDRFTHGSLQNARNQFHNSQFYHSVSVKGGSVNPITFTFPNQRSNNLYTVAFAPNWNTKWWITNKTATGFTLNFSDAPINAGTGSWQILENFKI
jgi:hypothetical protein